MPKVLDIKIGTYSSTTSLRRKDKLFSKVKEFAIVYIVLGDTIDQTETEILATVGVPPPFYPLRGAYCLSATATEEERILHPVTGELAGLWEVKCDFSSEVDVDADKPPEAKPPRVRWTSETEDEPLEHDAITGEPIVTAAGEPIIATTPVVYPVLEISRYERYPFDPDTMLDYANHTNKTAFWGAPAGSALMLPMDVDDDIIEGVKYNMVKYRVKFKIKRTANPKSSNAELTNKPWMFRPMHRGYLYYPGYAAGIAGIMGSELKPEINLDSHRNPVQCNLDADGHKLEEGEDPYYLEFNRFGEAEFNALSLGPF